MSGPQTRAGRQVAALWAKGKVVGTSEAEGYIRVIEQEAVRAYKAELAGTSPGAPCHIARRHDRRCERGQLRRPRRGPRPHRRAGAVSGLSADCHYGDHRYGGGATCQECGRFNAGLLSWFGVEKAQREGRHHGDHYHRTADAAAACRRPTHDEGPCADRGGCLVHEASDAFLATLEPA